MAEGLSSRGGSAELVTRTIEAVWRMEAAKVTAVVARLVGDIGLAEDLAQDAFVQAIEQWPRDGIPHRPGAWLTATARRRAIDRIRRDVNLAAKLELVGHAEELRVADLAEGDFDAVLEDIDDDVLGLVFAACHPSLTAQARISLTLRMIRWPDDSRDRTGSAHSGVDDRATDLAGEAIAPG